MRRLEHKDSALEEALRETLRLLEEDAFDPRLKTHKLHGKWTGAWAARAAYDLRIIFEFRKNAGRDEILLLAVGTHDDVY